MRTKYIFLAVPGSIFNFFNSAAIPYLLGNFMSLGCRTDSLVTKHVLGGVVSNYSTIKYRVSFVESKNEH